MIRREGFTWLLDFAPAKGGSAPPPPDPYATSAAQTQSNQQTAAYNAAINRGNTFTPYGSSTYTTRTDPTTGAPVYDQTISLSPDTQALLDQQMAQDRQLGNISQGMMSQVENAYRNPIDTSGLPSMVGSVGDNLPALQSSLDVQGPNLQGSLDTSGLPSLFGADNLGTERQQVQDALYSRYKSTLDPEYQQREERARTLLANQGVVQGSEAWNNEMDRLTRDRNAAYDTARTSSILGGANEMSTLSGIASQNRGQLFGERQAAGNFQNSARGQAMAEALARFGANNDARQQGLNQQVTAGNYANQARGQGIQELLALRNQPLNEFNALRSASQVEAPQFSGPNAVSMANTDVAGNINQAYQNQLDAWNARQQSSNSFLNSLMGVGGQLGSAAILASDRRLKTNVKRVGLLPQGIGVYDYEYAGDPKHERIRGVMAQEVERVDPDAVLEMDDGYKAVDYSRVLAKALEAA